MTVGTRRNFAWAKYPRHAELGSTVVTRHEALDRAAYIGLGPHDGQRFLEYKAIAEK